MRGWQDAGEAILPPRERCRLKSAQKTEAFTEDLVNQVAGDVRDS